MISEGPGQGTLFIMSMGMARVEELESGLQNSIEDDLLQLLQPSSGSLMNAQTEFGENNKNVIQL